MITDTDITSHGLQAGLLVIHLQHLGYVVIDTVGVVVLTVDLNVLHVRLLVGLVSVVMVRLRRGQVRLVLHRARQDVGSDINHLPINKIRNSLTGD